MTSAFFSRVFTVLCVLYVVAVEAFCRFATGESALTVLPAWLAKGEGRVVLPIAWLLVTPAVLAFLADHLRNIFVSLTGKPASFIFLGDRLREGFYVVPEAKPRGEPVFVPHFVAREQYPCRSFGGVYVRRILLRDAEGNLTAAEALSTVKTVIFSVAQLFLLMLSVGPWFSIAGQYKSGFTIRGSLPQAVDALALPPGFIWGIVGAVVAFYIVSIAAIAWATREARGVARARMLPLPRNIREGAVMQGTVVAAEDFDLGNNAERTASSARFYRRYAIRFSVLEFSQPVWLNWWAQRIHQGNISVTVGERTRELEAEKADTDKLFERLNRAMESGALVDFEIDADLCPMPKL